jgi:hypothetical protein
MNCKRCNDPARDRVCERCKDLIVREWLIRNRDLDCFVEDGLVERTFLATDFLATVGVEALRRPLTLPSSVGGIRGKIRSQEAA